jgi:hypothetical protein
MTFNLRLSRAHTGVVINVNPKTWLKSKDMVQMFVDFTLNQLDAEITSVPSRKLLWLLVMSTRCEFQHRHSIATSIFTSWFEWKEAILSTGCSQTAS